jgi:hypothetical protein
MLPSGKIRVGEGAGLLCLAFERSGRWDDAKGCLVPHPYTTVWVHEGWPGYPVARGMDWRGIIAEALGVSREAVRIGFGAGDFDVRPF